MLALDENMRLYFGFIQFSLPICVHDCDLSVPSTLLDVNKDESPPARRSYELSAGVARLTAPFGAFIEEQ